IRKFQGESLSKDRSERRIRRAEERELPPGEHLAGADADILARLLPDFSRWKERRGARGKCAARHLG
ncbi:MAG: hypothetical protein P8075_12505, partial [Deltaproteobacteria bacterium]